MYVIFCKNLIYNRHKKIIIQFLINVFIHTMSRSYIIDDEAKRYAKSLYDFMI